MKQPNRSTSGSDLPSAWAPKLKRYLIILVTVVGISSLAGPTVATVDAAHDIPQGDDCAWNGTSSTLWSDADNWGCGHVPVSGDDVTISSGAEQPFLSGGATVATLKLDGGWLTMSGSGALTVTGDAEVSGKSYITNDGQYSAASTTIQVGGELIAGGIGTFDGHFVVQWGAILRPAPGNAISLLGDLTNNGSLKSSTAGTGSYNFQGQMLVNEGEVEDSSILVLGSGEHTLSGDGTWRGQGRLRVNAATLQLGSDITYEAAILDLSANGRLDLSEYTLSLPSRNTLLSLPLGTEMVGTGKIIASGGGVIRNDGIISSTLQVLEQGVSAGGAGSFAGPLLIDAGATLTVTQFSNLLATGDVTVTGTLGPGSYLLFSGRTLTNNGAIQTNTVQFQGNDQTLKGTGYFSPTTLTRVNAGATVTLGSDHQLGTLQITTHGAVDITGRTLRLSAAGNALQRTGTLTLTDSTVVYNGTAPQTVGILGNLYHNLTISNSTGTSAAIAAFQLSSSGLLLVKSGTFTSPSCNCNDVQIDSNGRLVFFPQTTYRLSGDWTNSGTYAPAAGDVVTFSGAESQSIDGSSVTLFGALVISNTAGVELKTSAGVTRTLTLKGDLIVTGSNRLALDAGATTAGTGDVWGTVDRNGPLAAMYDYSFGNPDNLVRFSNTGTLPSSFSVTLTKSHPSGLPGSLQRKFVLGFTGGNAFSTTVRFHYRDSDLAGLTESAITPWHLVSNVWQAQPSSAASAAQNWLECAGVTGPGDWGLATLYKVFMPMFLGNAGSDSRNTARENLHIFPLVVH